MLKHIRDVKRYRPIDCAKLSIPYPKYLSKEYLGFWDICIYITNCLEVGSQI